MVIIFVPMRGGRERALTDERDPTILLQTGSLIKPLTLDSENLQQTTNNKHIKTRNPKPNGLPVLSFQLLLKAPERKGSLLEGIISLQLACMKGAFGLRRSAMGN